MNGINDVRERKTFLQSEREALYTRSEREMNNGMARNISKVVFRLDGILVFLSEAKNYMSFLLEYEEKKT